MSADRRASSSLLSSSRRASDELLAPLQVARFSGPGWRTFALSACARSVQQAIAHPRALAEVSLLHAAVAALADGGRGRRWVGISWVLSAVHLGLLEERRDLGWPNVISLLRANLPAVSDRLGTALPVIALVSDVCDGRLARAGTPTRFGAAADVMADTATWTWWAFIADPSRIVRAATLASWVGPVVAISVASFRRGEMVDLARPRWLRPGAAMEVVLTLRSLRHGPKACDIGSEGWARIGSIERSM